MDGRAVGRIGLVAILAVTGGFFVRAGIGALGGVGVFELPFGSAAFFLALGGVGVFPFGSAAFFLVAAAGVALGRQWGVVLAVATGFVTCAWVLVAFAVAILGIMGCNSCTDAETRPILIWLSAALGLSFAVGVIGVIGVAIRPAPPPASWGARAAPMPTSDPSRPGWGAYLRASDVPFPLWVRILVAVLAILWVLMPVIGDLLAQRVTDW